MDWQEVEAEFEPGYSRTVLSFRPLRSFVIAVPHAS